MVRFVPSTGVIWTH